MEAVAQWLDNHRIKAGEIIVPAETLPEPIIEEPLPSVEIPINEEPVVTLPSEPIVEPVPETPVVDTPTSTPPILPEEPIVLPPVEEPVSTTTPISKAKSKAGKLFARANIKNIKEKRNRA